MSRRPHSRYNRRKKPAWSTLARHRRREDCFKLKQQIRREKCSALFYTHQLLDEAGYDYPCEQWADVVFPGLDGITIWNAAIQTAAMRFWDMAENAAFEDADRVREAAGVPDDDSLYGSFIGRQGREVPPQPQECYGGLTWFDYLKKRENELCAGDFEVCEEFRIMPGYRYGIGLSITVHERVINTASIERAIRRFYELGEKNWRSAPLPRGELPRESSGTIGARQHKADPPK